MGARRVSVTDVPMEVIARCGLPALNLLDVKNLKLGYRLALVSMRPSHLLFTALIVSDFHFVLDSGEASSSCIEGSS